MSKKRVMGVNQQDDGVEGRAELDSHADTCVAGSDFLFVDDGMGKTTKVYPYSREYKPIENIKIGTAVTAYTESGTGQVWILVLNQCLFFGERLKTTLLCPNQIRHAGHQVYDIPRQFDASSSHSIRLIGGLEIPLKLNGIISYFPVHFPSQRELDEGTQVELTSQDEWDPNSEEFEEEEDKAIKRISTVFTQEPANGLSDHDEYERQARISALNSRSLVGEPLIEVISEDSDDRDLTKRLISSVQEASDDFTGDGLEGWEDTDIYGESAAVISGVFGSSGVFDAAKSGVFGMSSEKRESIVTKEVLARRWHIGLETADRTLKVTTQKGVRTVIHPLERRYKTAQRHLKFPSIKAKSFSDTMFSKVPSIHGDKAAQVFTIPPSYTHFYPMKSKSEAPRKLMQYIQDIGIVSELVTDNAGEEKGTEWMEVVKAHHIKAKSTEPYSPWQNRAEGEIKELKKMVMRVGQKTNTPRRLWGYLGKWAAATRRLTAHSNPSLDGRAPAEAVEGNTPDISEYAQFDWYQYVWYVDPTSSFPVPKKKLGRWIGVAHDVGQAMCFWVLPESGRPMARSSVASLPEDDLKNPDIQVQLRELDQKIQEKIGNKVATEAEFDIQVFDDIFEGYDADGDQEDSRYSEIEEADGHTPETMDEYISAEVLLPRDGEMIKGTVVARTKTDDGIALGKRNQNPILDTREYEVVFPDGSTEIFTANTIAECLYSQVDEHGQEFQVMKEISDHKADGSALKKDDGFFIDQHGRRSPKITTRGWKLLVEWKDGSSSWVPLKDLKESNPVQVAEYAVANKIVEEPAFAWWARKVLKKRDRIIKKVKSRYWKRTHKYGVELPHSVKEALNIDRQTGTTLWRDAIAKEMKNVMPAFEFNDKDEVPVGFKKIDCHMIFDVKMDLTRKARLVAGGHKTDPPKEMTYSSVVSRDSVRIAFTVAALNDLDVLMADVQNAYLNAKTTERVYTIAGPEFGKNEGRPVLIVRALYGLKSSGARWRDHLACTLRGAGYTGSRADGDVWMRPAVKKDGFKYWEYVLIHVDDILCVSENPKATMDYLGTHYTLKAGSVKEPDIYLGAAIKKWYIDGSDNPGKVRWAMSADMYVKRAVKDVETELEKVGKRLPTKVTTPLGAGYRPELDQTAELDARRCTYYQGLIGILRWMCELGRIDILVDVSLMSRFMTTPREGHLEQVFHIFAYLKKHDKSSMVFDDTRPQFDEARFKEQDWSEFYPGVKEAVPHNMPEARGNSIAMTAFVDADHAGCKVTRRSQTGVLIFLNRAPILWYSKRQNTVEASTFGSEFIAMKTCVEMVEGLRYKLRMLGIPIEGSTSVFCDNNSVVVNSSSPESVLKKKHNAISYHRVREAQAAGTIRIAFENGVTNLADIFTKCLPGPRLKELVGYILW